MVYTSQRAIRARTGTEHISPMTPRSSPDFGHVLGRVLGRGRFQRAASGNCHERREERPRYVSRRLLHLELNTRSRSRRSGHGTFQAGAEPEIQGHHICPPRETFDPRFASFE